MFPLLAVHPSMASFHNFSFLSEVLAPEAICLLIRQDLQLPRACFFEVYTILLDSWEFGDALHSDGSQNGIEEDDDRRFQQEWDNMGVEMKIRLRVGREHRARDLEAAGLHDFSGVAPAIMSTGT